MRNTFKVLLIDDDEINNFIVSKILTSHFTSCQIKATLNGQEGIDYLINLHKNEGNLPDIIFLDISMPVISGFDFLKLYDKHFNCLDKHPLIIMLSSSDRQEEKEQALENKYVAHYCSKPLTIEFVQQMSTHLN